MKTERRFQGVGVSPGIARGTAFVHRPDEEQPPKYPVEADEMEEEIARLHDALATTRSQILELQRKVEDSLGAKDAAIFEAHLMVVEDGVFIGEVEKTLRKDLCNAEHAFSSVIHRYVKSLGAVDDPYLRERAVDIQDVGRRVIHNLLGRQPRDAAGGDRARPHARRHRAGEPRGAAGIRHRSRRAHLAHGDHGAFAEHPRGARPPRAAR